MLRAGVIGLGQIGLMYDFDKNRKGPNSHSLAYQLNPDINLVAGQDIRKEQEVYLKEIAPQSMFYEDLSIILNQEQLDIISICTPPKLHLPMIKQILAQASPKVIFCEKPVVNTLEEVRELKHLLNQSGCLFVPNLSRRWNAGVQHIASVVRNGTYGSMQKIHIRYTRGIFNTGSHVFDLLKFLGQAITEVRVLYKVETSSDREYDPSFSFSFETENGAHGYAEAFKDALYYMFEIDFYLESGKIEFRMSGDQINILEKDKHPLFDNFHALRVVDEKKGLLEQSNIAAAVNHIVRVLEGKESLLCSLDDGVYPLYVSDALMRSAQNQNSKEQVGDELS